MGDRGDARPVVGHVGEPGTDAVDQLALLPGRLWDIGAGTGTIGTEWMRGDPTRGAIATEPRADRADRVERNAAALGVPGLAVVRGSAPEALLRPDSVFPGGGGPREALSSGAGPS